VKKISSLSPLKIFWDIDGTLLNTNGAAAIPFARAVSKFAQQEVNIDRKKLSGFTDYEIAKHLLNSLGKSASLEQITNILNNYSNELPDYLQAKKAVVVKSALESLIAFKKFANVELAIGAKAKLEYANLFDFFDIKNIFCATEIYWNRDLIISNAKRSLRRDQIGIVIGDSIRDVLSAKRSDMTIIAVATGAHSSSELLNQDPDYVLENKWVFPELIEAIEKVLKDRFIAN
jgi:phosphoglycolate phosphatase-like HAD superfamily hydrolase